MAWISSVYLYYKASRQLTMRNTSPFLNHLYLASLSSQHQNHQVRNIRTKSLSHHQRKKVVSRVPRFFFCDGPLRPGFQPLLREAWVLYGASRRSFPRRDLRTALGLLLRRHFWREFKKGLGENRLFFFGHSHLRSSGWFDVRLMCEGISKQVHLKDWSHLNHWSSWRCSLDSIREWSR